MIEIQDNIKLVLIVIWSLLILASLIVFTLTKINPQKDYRELNNRTKSWWAMIAVFTFALLTNRTFSFYFLGFMSFVVLKEFFSMIPTRRADRRVLFWAYITIPFQYYWASIGWYGMFIIFIPVYMFLFIPVRLIFSQQTEGFLRSTSIIQWGIMLSVFAISHTAFLLQLPPHQLSPSGGVGLLLFLVFLTEFNDVAQYTWGKLFGKHKIISKISPKKTWEGFIGGVISTTVLAFFVAPYITPFSLDYSIYAGLLISITGFLGDITISAVKRDIGVKDTGSSIPGHGGMLDRVDSLTFTAPLFFHFIWYFYY